MWNTKIEKTNSNTYKYPHSFNVASFGYSTQVGSWVHYPKEIVNALIYTISGRAFAAFTPFNKNPKNLFTSVSMGLRQIAGFLAIYPRVEKCGIFGVWSQSKETPTTEFEVCTLVPNWLINCHITINEYYLYNYCTI